MKSSAFLASAACLLSSTKGQQFVMYTGSTMSDGDDNAVQRADPIISPGTFSGHVHQFTGSNGLAPEVTYESLQQSSCTTVGASSGESNMADKSVYWHPALYMEAADNSGFIRVPTLGHKFYYKDVGVGKKREPFEFPQGFRMLAGNPFMRAAASDVQQQNITQWICHGSSGNNQGTDGGFPTGVTDCDSYPGFNGAIHFPHCWNGDDFNQADPSAHISYPEGDIQNGECPSSHPIRLPHIFVENQFNLHDMVDKVKPDTFTLAMGDNTGYGWHFDFFNGWDDGALPKLFENCPQGAFGNEDIGACPDFKAGAPTNQCSQKVSYKEDVTKPGKALPGCNPISDVNPAPKLLAAPLGVYSTVCNAVGGLLGGSHSGSPQKPAKQSPSAASPPGYGDSSTASVSMSPQASGTGSPASTTLLTSSKPTATASTSPSTSGNELSCPGSDGTLHHSSGKTFRIQCNTDHAGGDLKALSANSLSECVDACASEQGCVDVSFMGNGCYLKSSLGEKHENKMVSGARLVNVHRHGAKHRRGGRF